MKIVIVQRSQQGVINARDIIQPMQQSVQGIFIGSINGGDDVGIVIDPVQGAPPLSVTVSWYTGGRSRYGCWNYVKRPAPSTGGGIVKRSGICWRMAKGWRRLHRRTKLAEIVQR